MAQVSGWEEQGGSGHMQVVVSETAILATDSPTELPFGPACITLLRTAGSLPRDALPHC